MRKIIKNNNKNIIFLKKNYLFHNYFIIFSGINTTTSNLISNKTLPKRVSLNWQGVALLVNKRVTGKPYGAYYIRDVALGYRTNSKIESILEQLGISKEFRKEAI